jgi:TonB family protein
LGSTFCAYVATNVTLGFKLAEPSEPEMIQVISDFRNGRVPTRSTVRVEGEIANRPLVTLLAIKSQPAQDVVLTSSEVAIGVRDDGTVFSAKLAKGCGDKGADDEAVRLARAARFARAPGGIAPKGADALTWGSLVFQWHTVAPPTNSMPRK